MWLMDLFHNDCVGGDIVWKIRKKRRKQGRDECMNMFSTIKNTCFKASSKISLNNKVTLWPWWYTCFIGCIIVQGRSFREKPQKNFLLPGCRPSHMDWAWGVSVLQNRPGSSQRIILSCVDKLTKENTGFLFKMDWLNVFKDFFSKFIYLLNP